MAALVTVAGPEKRRGHVFGYTVINDTTARELQMKHLQWFKGKSLDGFCPMEPVNGDVMETEIEGIGTRRNRIVAAWSVRFTPLPE